MTSVGPSPPLATTLEDDPYLPAAVPGDNAPPPKKSRAWLGWLVLIVGFTIFCAYSGSGPQPERVVEARATPSAWSMPWSWVPLALFAAAALWFYRQLRGSSSFQDKQNPALLALADHDLERALALYEALLPAHGSAANGSVLRLGIALVQARLGRQDASRDTLLAVEKAPGVWSGNSRILAALGLAQTFALRGELGRAEAWLTEANKRSEKLSSRSLYLIGELRLVEAMLLARRGEAADALAILERDWSRLERGMTATHLKPAVLLRAYLTSVVGGPREEGNASPWVAQLRTSHPLDTAFLYASWPALATWVEAQGLSRIARTEASTAAQ